MKKISFSEKYGLHQAVLSKQKTMTRRIARTIKPLYIEGEIVAVAERYIDICPPGALEASYLQQKAGWLNKMFVEAHIMPHHIRILHVRKERLQDISYEDCRKEGIEDWICQRKRQSGFFDTAKDKFCNYSSPRIAFAALIDKISGKGTWESNPEVWVYEFELID